MAYQPSWVIQCQSNPTKNSSDTVEHIAGGIKEFSTIPKGFSPKGNVIAWLEFELAYFKAIVQYFSHFSMQTLPLFICTLSDMKYSYLIQIICSRIVSSIPFSY